jgi:4-amino-4-deoxy-L-arabinose transferase-like glycosyltransferase
MTRKSIDETASMGAPRGNPQRAKAARVAPIPTASRGFVWVSLGFATLYAAALVITARPIGYSRDESFYFDAARRHADWYRLLLEHRDTALMRNVVDSYFATNHEHPPLMKTLFGLSHSYLFQQWHWVSYEGLSFRLPTMIIAGLGIVLVALWGARSLSRTAGAVAALCLAFMPRFFHHAHLACFDVPVACLCLASAFAWSRALESRRLGWSLLLGLVYGLTLATKHNAWLLPGAFLVHGILSKGRTFWHASWHERARLMMPLFALLLIAPLVLYALWPWIWFDTWDRLVFWFRFHMKHEYYNMEFLGVTYWKPPMPLAYAWVMTLATVPLTTLALFLWGVLSGTRSLVASRFRSSNTRPKPSVDSRVNSDFLLWSICLVTFCSPWLSSDTPIFGGTKHWLTAYPFLGLIAGLGFECVARRLPNVLSGRWQQSKRLDLVRVALAVLVLLPGAFIVNDMGPWGLSTYTPVVGGASGAATLGLNRTFWGYTTVALAHDLAMHAPARLYLHDMTSGAWDMHQRDGTAPGKVHGTSSITESDLAVYHHEPHMERVEYQVWATYGSSTPASVGTCEGVPVVWFFDRHRAKNLSQ